jgi:hypothetical protein
LVLEAQVSIGRVSDQDLGTISTTTKTKQKPFLKQKQKQKQNKNQRHRKIKAGKFWHNS